MNHHAAGKAATKSATRQSILKPLSRVVPTRLSSAPVVRGRRWEDKGEARLCTSAEGMLGVASIQRNVSSLYFVTGRYGTSVVAAHLAQADCCLAAASLRSLVCPGI